MINKTVTVGRVGGVYYNTNNVTVSIAVKRAFKNSQGTFETDWLNYKAFGKTAENLNKYVSKGDIIGVEGRVNTYKDKEGKTQMSLSMDKFYFISKKDTSDNTSNSTSYKETIEQNNNKYGIDDDSLPF